MRIKFTAQNPAWLQVRTKKKHCTIATVVKCISSFYFGERERYISYTISVKRSRDWVTRIYGYILSVVSLYIYAHKSNVARRSSVQFSVQFHLYSRSTRFLSPHSLPNKNTRKKRKYQKKYIQVLRQDFPSIFLVIF